jgi:dephospho-CoA kinase
MKVIGIVGYPASGKGEFSKIAQEYGIPVVTMGDMIRRKTAEAGLPLTDECIGATARQLRAEYGDDAVALLTAEEVAKLSENTVIIDGIRGDAEIACFKSVFPDFTLVSVAASFETRLFRMQERGRTDDTVTDAALRSRDSREEGFGLARAMRLAGVCIENEATREEFQEKIRSFFRSLP